LFETPGDAKILDDISSLSYFLSGFSAGQRAIPIGSQKANQSLLDEMSMSQEKQN